MLGTFGFEFADDGSVRSEPVRLRRGGPGKRDRQRQEGRQLRRHTSVTWPHVSKDSTRRCFKCAVWTLREFPQYHNADQKEGLRHLHGRIPNEEAVGCGILGGSKALVIPLGIDRGG